MKNTSITKKIDELGRVVIPKDIRRVLGVEPLDYLKMELDGDTLVIKKNSNKCIFCGSEKSLSEHMEKHICAKCLTTLTKND